MSSESRASGFLNIRREFKIIERSREGFFENTFSDFFIISVRVRFLNLFLIFLNIFLYFLFSNYCGFSQP